MNDKESGKVPGTEEENKSEDGKERKRPDRKDYFTWKAGDVEISYGMDDFLKKHPNARLVSGAETQKRMNSEDKDKEKKSDE